MNRVPLVNDIEGPGTSGLLIATVPRTLEWPACINPVVKDPSDRMEAFITAEVGYSGDPGTTICRCSDVSSPVIMWLVVCLLGESEAGLLGKPLKLASRALTAAVCIMFSTHTVSMSLLYIARQMKM